MRRSSEALTKMIPQQQPVCPHQLGRWLLRTARSTQTYRDGGLRLPEHRGGRLVVDRAPCVFTPGHAGEHRDQEGRAWL
jgi:hypothetical protein